MRGLKNFPQKKQVAQAIHTLQTLEPTPEHLLSLYSQWARVDPRIAESLVYYLKNKWEFINPLQLNNELQKQPWPAAMGVILNFIDLYSDNRAWHLKTRANMSLKKFRLWSALVMSKIEPENYAQFFYGFRNFAGKIMREEASTNLLPYLKWGYLGCDLLVKTFDFPRRNPWPKADRLKILKKLLTKNKKITVRDYRQALAFQISNRQAERDFIEIGARAKGKTKARVYYC